MVGCKCSPIVGHMSSHVRPWDQCQALQKQGKGNEWVYWLKEMFLFYLKSYQYMSCAGNHRCFGFICATSKKMSRRQYCIVPLPILSVLSSTIFPELWDLGKVGMCVPCMVKHLESLISSAFWMVLWLCINAYSLQ